ncbi:MAG: tRNA pseudouridine(55) synthase TruB [bacterium]
MSARRTSGGLDGILLVDKPAGWTSHDVVAKARGILGQRRIGHTGTLDPMATGLLVLCLGQATRVVEFMVGHDKRYTGTIKLGASTTTDDAEGLVFNRRAVPGLDRPALDAALGRFRGAIMQRPPAFSAIKVGGKRAYDVARAGHPVELVERQVMVHTFNAWPAGADELSIDLTCSSGTYIRSIARDLGEVLGCGGYLTSLRRHRVGSFLVSDATTLEDIAKAVRTGGLEELVLATDDGIADLDVAILGAEASTIISNGGWWKSDEPLVRASDCVRIYSTAGAFVGLGSVAETGEIRPSKVFERPNSPK